MIMSEEKSKEAFAKEFFSNFAYRKGDMRARMSIADAYDEIFGDRPTVQYVREADGDLDKYYEVLLECLRKGKRYELSAADREDIERLDKEGVPHDGYA